MFTRKIVSWLWEWLNKNIESCLNDKEDPECNLVNGTRRDLSIVSLINYMMIPFLVSKIKSKYVDDLNKMIVLLSSLIFADKI